MAHSKDNNGPEYLTEKVAYGSKKRAYDDDSDVDDEEGALPRGKDIATLQRYPSEAVNQPLVEMRRVLQDTVLTLAMGIARDLDSTVGATASVRAPVPAPPRRLQSAIPSWGPIPSIDPMQTSVDMLQAAMNLMLEKMNELDSVPSLLDTAVDLLRNISDQNVEIIHLLSGADDAVAI